jgi:hypothetical protein
MRQFGAVPATLSPITGWVGIGRGPTPIVQISSNWTVRSSGLDLCSMVVRCFTVAVGCGAPYRSRSACPLFVVYDREDNENMRQL